MTTEVRKEMLVRTVGSVFITMLGLDVTPSTIPWRPVGRLEWSSAASVHSPAGLQIRGLDPVYASA
jgi:hypothetical protein